jgi:hypothetical protein
MKNEMIENISEKRSHCLIDSVLNRNHFAFDELLLINFRLSLIRLSNNITIR